MSVLPTAADYPFRLRACKAESKAINKRSAAGSSKPAAERLIVVKPVSTSYQP